MTKESTYREKGRAVFLAVMMVLSVVAMSAAFAGGAAAEASFNDSNYDEGPSYEAGADIDDVWIGQQLEFTGVNADGIEIYQGLNEDGSDESAETTLQVDSDGEATLDTSDLEAGEPYTIVDGSDSSEGEEVGVPMGTQPSGQMKKSWMSISIAQLSQKMVTLTLTSAPSATISG